MRRAGIMIAFLMVALFPPNSTPSQSYENAEPLQLSQTTLPYNGEDENDLFDEDSLLSEQRIFSRQVYLEKLPPLEGKEKIIWAFRMAEADLFQ